MNDTNATSKFPQQHSDDGVKALSKLLPVAIAIVLANGLVFVLFYRCPRLRTSSNYLLLNLAVCDFCTGAIAIPYFIVYSFAILPKELHYGIYASHTLLAVSGAYHILVITALKYLATVSPLKHYAVTKSLVLKIVLGVWIISTVFAVIPLVWQDTKASQRWQTIHTAVCIVAVFLIPHIFMIYAFVAMFRVINNRQRPSMAQNDMSRNQKKNNSDRKCIFVFLSMAILFTCCSLAYFTMYYIAMGVPVLFNVLEGFMIIRHITSFANPLLYTFFKSDFWSALKNLLRVDKKASFSAQKIQTLSSNLRGRLRSGSSVNNIT
ncbi:RYamide receptor-like [Stylophora pistillata]|uniref:RYamide receptor-like n=1 Tax=Stylophora pistillata TaxID=50429 RepID=UPI000C044AC0|nr:RYamide receptor-like [Stylophora pistillata]